MENFLRVYFGDSQSNCGKFGFFKSNLYLYLIINFL